jgi:hypothetical protein
VLAHLVRLGSTGLAAAKAVGLTLAAALATVVVSTPRGGVAMLKTRVEVDLGWSRKSEPSGPPGQSQTGLDLGCRRARPVSGGAGQQEQAVGARRICCWAGVLLLAPVGEAGLGGRIEGEIEVPGPLTRAGGNGWGAGHRIRPHPRGSKRSSGGSAKRIGFKCREGCRGR